MISTNLKHLEQIQMSTWNDLNAIICCHWDAVYGEQRQKYLYLLLDSLAINKKLPGRVVISFTSCIAPPQIKKYPFQITTIYRGKKPISQASQLLMTIYEERSAYILLLDDDDLTSPDLIERHFQVWEAMQNPKYFYFQCGLTRGCGMFGNPISDAKCFDQKWPLSKKYDQSCECDYGGTCCSVKVMIYYLKRLLVTGYSLENFAVDVRLYEMGSVDNEDIHHKFIQDNLTVIDLKPEDDPTLIRKYRIEEPLYYHRKWRVAKRYTGSDEEVWGKIREIKEQQKY